MMDEPKPQPVSFFDWADVYEGLRVQGLSPDRAGFDAYRTAHGDMARDEAIRCLTATAVQAREDAAARAAAPPRTAPKQAAKPAARKGKR